MRHKTQHGRASAALTVTTCEAAARPRSAKAAGWYHIFHLDDLRAIAPRWLHYTEQMRSNPQKYWDVNGSKSSWHRLARQAVGRESRPSEDARSHAAVPL